METHLVHGHLGGYYISSDEPEFIEQYCETCGDYDYIETSWDADEENARLNALLKYFLQNSINTKNDLDLKVDEYSDCSLEMKEIIDCILDEIDYDSEETYNIVTYLFENHEINEEEYNKIIHLSMFNKIRQTKMINKIKNTYIEDSKVLKLCMVDKKQKVEQ